MKKFLAVILCLAGLCAAAAAVYLSVQFMDTKPILLTPPDEAKTRVVAMMDAVCQGDYAEASQSILGTPSLGVDREAGSDVGIMIWEAFQESLSYELVGECYTTDQGLAQNVTVTCLDITSVTEQLRDRSQTMLEQRVAEAENVSEIYDDNNEYREDFVMDILHTAVTDALKENTREMTVELTVRLSYQDGSWWVVADEALLDAISGGILY